MMEPIRVTLGCSLWPLFYLISYAFLWRSTLLKPWSFDYYVIVRLLPMGFRWTSGGLPVGLWSASGGLPVKPFLWESFLGKFSDLFSIMFCFVFYFRQFFFIFRNQFSTIVNYVINQLIKTFQIIRFFDLSRIDFLNLRSHLQGLSRVWISGPRLVFTPI